MSETEPTKEPLATVAICVPTGDMVHMDFVMHLYALIDYSKRKNFNVVLINEKTSHIDIGRYNLVKAAQSVYADYVLFLDSDMTFPFTALERLHGHGKMIVGSSYISRRSPHRFVHTDLDGSCSPFKYGLAALGDGADGIREVMRIPSGVMLVNMKVFNAMAEPWFNSRWNPVKEQRISEDNAFCDDAREQGYEIWLDEFLTGEVGHIGQTVYAPEPCLDGIKTMTIDLNPDLPEPMPEEIAA